MLRQPFTATVHIVLVILMLSGFVLIGQQFDMTLYKAGLILLTASTIAQIAFGNIPPHFDLKRAMRLFWPFMGIILIVFVLGFVLTPLLYALGR
ncbi:MAG: hypothetical protein RMM31_02895 [Anaerolineae bacterium]|nr:hypothetical protein [Anaerolineae bacterium]